MQNTSDNNNLPDDPDSNPDDTLREEPEEYLCAAKYLIELIQQDLNFGRKETIAPRLKRAIEHLTGLSYYFPTLPPPDKMITEEVAKDFYDKLGYSEELPTTTGLYRVATKESNYYLSYVAVTMNDYRNLVVHDDFGINDVANYATNRGGETAFWLKIN